MSVPDGLRTQQLRPLWEAVHRRLSSGRPVARVRVGPLDEGQRGAVADLLGLDQMPGETCTVSVEKLDAVLAEAGTDVAAVVAALVGPVGDRSGDRARAEAERAELWAWLNDHAEVRRQPALGDWAAQVKRAGLIQGSVAQTRRTLTQALAVLARLPVEGQPLPTLAGEVIGDTHALDDGTRLSGLVLRALAAMFDMPVPTAAQERRALWECAGIAADTLSSVVLVAGLRPDGTGTAGEIARCCAEMGQAAALTLAQLRESEWHSAPPVVWVVENPSILAMALRRFGVECPPMVCTSGWPNSAVMLVLRRLAHLGTQVRYHGDFDGEGLRIAAYVVEKTGARPWRMDTTDYLHGLRPEVRGPAPGRVSEVPWDNHLAETIRTHDQAVAEEQVADELLNDLAHEIPPSPEA